MKIIRLQDLAWVPASHEDPKSAGVLKKVLLEKSDFIEGRPQTINWCALKVGRSFQPHYHEDLEEIFILVKGRARLRVGEEEAELETRQAVAVPPLLAHEMTNIGDEEVEYIVVGISSGKGGRTVNV